MKNVNINVVLLVVLVVLVSSWLIPACFNKTVLPKEHEICQTEDEMAQAMKLAEYIEKNSEWHLGVIVVCEE